MLGDGMLNDKLRNIQASESCLISLNWIRCPVKNGNEDVRGQYFQIGARTRGDSGNIAMVVGTGSRFQHDVAMWAKVVIAVSVKLLVWLILQCREIFRKVQRMKSHGFCCFSSRKMTREPLMKQLEEVRRLLLQLSRIMTLSCLKSGPYKEYNGIKSFQMVKNDICFISVRRLRSVDHLQSQGMMSTVWFVLQPSSFAAYQLLKMNSWNFMIWRICVKGCHLIVMLKPFYLSAGKCL